MGKIKKITVAIILLALLLIISNVVNASDTTNTVLTAKVTAPETVKASDGINPQTVDVTVMLDAPVSKGAFTISYGESNGAYLSYQSCNIEGIKESEDGSLEFDLGENTTDKIVITLSVNGWAGDSSIVVFMPKEGSFGIGDKVFDKVIVDGEPKITLLDPIPDRLDHYDTSDGPGNESDDTPKISKRTLNDSNTGVEVTVNTESVSKLKVESLEKESDAYKKLTKEMKNYIIASAYDISIEQGKYEGDIQVTIKVDKKYEGRNACILHLRSDGTIENFTGKVTDGKVAVVVSELSPFLVGVSEPESKLDISPKTGDDFSVLIVSSLVLLTLVTIIKLRKD